jgi:hypothetical protein
VPGVPPCATLFHPAPGAPGKFAAMQISDVQMKKNGCRIMRFNFQIFKSAHFQIWIY